MNISLRCLHESQYSETSNYPSNSEIYEEEPRNNDKFVSPLPLR